MSNRITWPCPLCGTTVESLASAVKRGRLCDSCKGIINAPSTSIQPTQDEPVADVQSASEPVRPVMKRRSSAQPERKSVPSRPVTPNAQSTFWPWAKFYSFSFLLIGSVACGGFLLLHERGLVEMPHFNVTRPPNANTKAEALVEIVSAPEEMNNEAFNEPLEEDPRLSTNGCVGEPDEDARIAFVDDPRQSALLKQVETQEYNVKHIFERQFLPNNLVIFKGVMKAANAFNKNEDLRSFSDSIAETRRKSEPEKVKPVENPEINRRIKAFNAADTFPSSVPLNEAAFHQRALAAAPKGAPEYCTGMPVTYQAVAIVEACLAVAKKQVTLEQYLAVIRMTTRRLAARISIPVLVDLPGFKNCTMYCISWREAPDQRESIERSRAKSLKSCSAIIEALPEFDNESLEKVISYFNDTKYTKVTFDEVMYDLNSCQCAHPNGWHLRLASVEQIILMSKDWESQQGETEYISLADIIDPVLELAKGSAKSTRRTSAPSGLTLSGTVYGSNRKHVGKGFLVKVYQNRDELEVVPGLYFAEKVFTDANGKYTITIFAGNRVTVSIDDKKNFEIAKVEGSVVHDIQLK